jgi:prolyl-tRNA synthetase
MLLVRGDHMGNEVKIGKVPGLAGWRWASEAEIVAATGCRPGYLGPVGIPPDMPLIVDRQVGAMGDFVCGANEADFHLTGVNFGRDCREPDVVADIRSVVAGDPSPDGNGTLAIVRGIEVGHVFALGDVYSTAMGATYLDTAGQSHVIQMGCYGIGVTRIVAAAIEQNHDKDGIVWPVPIAPYEVELVALQTDDAKLVEACDRIYEQLTQAGIEVLYDDRDERPGVKFKDADLVGIPYRIAVGKKGLVEGIAEVKLRRGPEVRKIKIDEVAALVAGEVRKERL